MLDDGLTKLVSLDTSSRFLNNTLTELFHEDLSDKQIDQIFAVMALCPQQIFQCLTNYPERMLKYLNWQGHVDNKEGRCPCRQCCIARNMYGENLSMAMGCAWYLYKNWPLPNVWLGVRVKDQKSADERIPLLLKTPAAVRWVLSEGPVDLRQYSDIGTVNI